MILLFLSSKINCGSIILVFKRCESEVVSWKIQEDVVHNLKLLIFLKSYGSPIMGVNATCRAVYKSTKVYNKKKKEKNISKSDSKI